MEKTITVRGTGKLSVSPDLITVGLTVRKQDKDYSEAMIGLSKLVDALREGISGIGFEPKELKTSSFNVRTEYESVRDQNGVYRQVFAGYVCEHQLKLDFDFDTDKLSEVLTSISRCIAEPELYVSFSVKDKDAVSDRLLASAAKNAKKRAKLLAEASGAELGELLSITYDWHELSFVSPTRYNGAMMKTRAMAEDCAVGGGIEPESIDLSDSAVFVWEIL